MIFSDGMAALRRMVRSWYELTRNEQRALILILALFLLGLAARAWHLGHTRPDNAAGSPLSDSSVRR